MRQLLQERAEQNDIYVTGLNYPVPPSSQFYVQCFQYLQLLLFGLVFFGEPLFNSIALPVPPLIHSMAENKMGSFMCRVFLNKVFAVVDWHRY